MLVAVYCVLLLPIIPRWTDNAPLLASFSNDEPFITQQLDGMTHPPFGNPSNFLEPKNADTIPSYWYGYRYYNLIYYGGTYLDVGFIPFATLKALGAPTFPTAPVILRTISFLAGLAGLILLYNFARRHWTSFAAIFATTALLFEPRFLEMAGMIHPDALQLALVLLTLIVAVRQARLGDRASTVACGVLVGVIQGTKSGAPFMVPAVTAAVVIGVAATRRAPSSARAWVSQVGVITRRLALVGGAALVGFAVSTPYALFDPYYRRTTRSAYALLTGTSPLIPVTFASWYESIRLELGWPFLVAVLAGVVWFLVGLVRTRRADPAHALALVLGASNLLWFTSIGRFWIVLYYLLPALGLLAIFAGAVIERAALLVCGGRGWWPARLALLGAVVVAVILGNGRPAALATNIAAGIDAARTPQVRVGNWAYDHVRPKARILFDDEAYFDPARFPDQQTNANVLRYTDLFRKQPDYIVLTDYPPGSNWIAIKRRTQRFGKWSDDPYSVRLYQDLIDRNPRPYTPGPTPVRYIDLVDAGQRIDDTAGQPAWFRVFDRLYRIYHRHYPGLQAKLSADHRLLLYHVERRFYDQRTPFGVVAARARPISSPSVAGNDAAKAFDGMGYVWLADARGRAAQGAYIGADYGEPTTVAKVRIKWVAERWLPSRLVVQYSDNGQSWRTAVTWHEVAPPDQHDSPGLKRWFEAIPLPRSGAHRLWRVQAVDVPAGNYFGLDELEFVR